MGPSNPACVSCGRWKGASNWGMSPLINGNHASLDVLVVGEAPSAECDTDGVPMRSGPFLELVRGPLSQTPWKVGYTHMVRCWADKKPTAKELGYCHEAYLSPFILEYQPRVIWALGAVVARKLLNSQLSLDKIRSLGVSYTAEGVPVVVLESPMLHSKWMPIAQGGLDLRPKYKRALELTHRILTGQYKPETFDFNLIRTPQEAKGMAEFLQNDCQPLVGFDTEVGLQTGVNFAEQSERVLYLTSGFSAQDAAGTYHTFSVDHEEWDRRDTYQMLHGTLKGKVPLATQAFFDFNLAYWQAGFDIYPKSPVYHDIHLLRWAQDQTTTNNGLEDQLCAYLGWASYKAEMDELKAVSAKNLVIPPDSLLDEVDYRHIKWDHYDKFMLYQAKDALGTARLGYEVYLDPDTGYQVPLERFNLNGYHISLRAIRALSYMSRNGAPVNLETLHRYQAENLVPIQHYTGWLNNHPLTHKIFPGVELNPKSAPQMHKLCVALGISTKGRTKKTEEMQVDQEELLRQSGAWFESDHLKRGAPTGDKFKDIQRDFFWAILQARYNLDRNSKSQGLINFAQDPKGWVNSNGTPLHRLHPLFKVGKMDGGNKGGGGGIDTGRVSTIWPSLGNQEKSKRLRETFEAPAGWVVAEWDLAAAEPRLFGHLADEPSWKEIFQLQANPATANDPASNIYRREWCSYKALQGIKYDPEQLSKEEYAMAKVLILRLCYDSSPQGITDSDGIPLELTTSFAENFWARNTKLQAFAYAARKQIMKDGWITSCSGRRGQYRLYNNYRPDDDIHWNLPLWKLQRELRISGTDAHSLRSGMNALIQGPTSDVTLTACIDLIDYMFLHNIRWLSPFNMVHDSIWALVREDKVEEADVIVSDIMTDPARMLRWRILANIPTEGNRIMRNSLSIGRHMGAMEEVRK